MKTWIDYLTKLSIAIAVIGLLISFAISYKSQGMDEGLIAGEQELEEFKKHIGYDTSNHFSGGDGRTYERFAGVYGWISWLFGISTIGILLSRLKLSVHPAIGYIVTGLSLLVILYNLRLLIRTKGWMESLFWEAPRNAFAYLTITYDWILVGITLVLIVTQLSTLVLHRKLGRDPRT